MNSDDRAKLIRERFGALKFARRAAWLERKRRKRQNFKFRSALWIAPRLPTMGFAKMPSAPSLDPKPNRRESKPILAVIADKWTEDQMKGPEHANQ